MDTRHTENPCSSSSQPFSQRNNEYSDPKIPYKSDVLVICIPYPLTFDSTHSLIDAHIYNAKSLLYPSLIGFITAKVDRRVYPCVMHLYVPVDIVTRTFSIFEQVQRALTRVHVFDLPPDTYAINIWRVTNAISEYIETWIRNVACSQIHAMQTLYI